MLIDPNVNKNKTLSYVTSATSCGSKWFLMCVQIKYGMMLTYFSQVLPKNLLWLWKYIREYYKKWIHFLPFTYVGLVHGPEPLPWAMNFYNLSGEVYENQMMHSVYFPPAVDVERKIF